MSVKRPPVVHLRLRPEQREALEALRLTIGGETVPSLHATILVAIDRGIMALRAKNG